MFEEVNKECNCDGLSTEDFHYAISRSPDFPRYINVQYCESAASDVLLFIGVAHLASEFDSIYRQFYPNFYTIIFCVTKIISTLIFFSSKL